MENKMCDLKSLPDLFRDTGNEIDFVHSASGESNDDSFVQSLRTQECDQTLKKARKIMANPMKWKCTTIEKRHFLINTTCRLITVKRKRLITEQGVEAEEDDWMEDEDEADNEKNKRKTELSRRKFFFMYFFCEGRENIDEKFGKAFTDVPKFLSDKVQSRRIPATQSPLPQHGEF
ncbi:hypothetical protein AVEN_159245-1 [Araneus ventricosus]|uniref:Uncharacterized protein n=1 Tax=Araneus ventricosus TaxID=182803 RepID=A0A4Y2A0I1_ARAVE|nr:hypothetical protein AVEN_159245-1 [Araneus ventricosus]